MVLVSSGNSGLFYGIDRVGWGLNSERGARGACVPRGTGGKVKTEWTFGKNSKIMSLHAGLLLHEEDGQCGIVRYCAECLSSKVF
jgi:hypothetical protein